MLAVKAPLAEFLLSSISDHALYANTAAKKGTVGKNATRILAHGAG